MAWHASDDMDHRAGMLGPFHPAVLMHQAEQAAGLVGEAHVHRNHPLVELVLDGR
jgi:hypothetical protein